MPTPYILKVQFVGVTKSSYGHGKDELVNMLLKHTHVRAHIGLRVSLLSLGLLVFCIFKRIKFKNEMHEWVQRQQRLLSAHGTYKDSILCPLKCPKAPWRDFQPVATPMEMGVGGPLKVASFRQAALNSHCWASAWLTSWWGNQKPRDLGSLRSQVGIWTLCPLKPGPWRQGLAIPSPHPPTGSQPSPPASTVKI